MWSCVGFVAHDVKYFLKERLKSLKFNHVGASNNAKSCAVSNNQLIYVLALHGQTHLHLRNNGKNKLN